jgi:hypothetical protein
MVVLVSLGWVVIALTYAASLAIGFDASFLLASIAITAVAMVAALR